MRENNKQKKRGLKGILEQHRQEYLNNKANNKSIEEHSGHWQRFTLLLSPFFFLCFYYQIPDLNIFFLGDEFSHIEPRSPMNVGILMAFFLGIYLFLSAYISSLTRYETKLFSIEKKLLLFFSKIQFISLGVVGLYVRAIIKVTIMYATILCIAMMMFTANFTPEFDGVLKQTEFAGAYNENILIFSLLFAALLSLKIFTKENKSIESFSAIGLIVVGLGSIPIMIFIGIKGFLPESIIGESKMPYDALILIKVVLLLLVSYLSFLEKQSILKGLVLHFVFPALITALALFSVNSLMLNTKMAKSTSIPLNTLSVEINGKEHKYLRGYEFIAGTTKAEQFKETLVENYILEGNLTGLSVYSELSNAYKGNEKEIISLILELRERKVNLLKGAKSRFDSFNTDFADRNYFMLYHMYKFQNLEKENDIVELIESEQYDDAVKLYIKYFTNKEEGSSDVSMELYEITRMLIASKMATIDYNLIIDEKVREKFKESINSLGKANEKKSYSKEDVLEGIRLFKGN